MKSHPRAPRDYDKWLTTLSDHDFALRLDADRRLFAADANGEGFPRLAMCLEERDRRQAQKAEHV